MKNMSTGAGLALLGLGIAVHPLLSGLASSATASASTAPAAAALGSAASAQAGPTVVWYGVGSDPSTAARVDSAPFIRTTMMVDRIYRAWSDGTIEMKRVGYGYFNDIWPDLCSNGLGCTSPWIVISSPNQGFKAAADINADERVDGADLASVLGNWGDAPRVPFPPSDCPLNLINP